MRQKLFCFVFMNHFNDKLYYIIPVNILVSFYSLACQVHLDITLAYLGFFAEVLLTFLLHIKSESMSYKIDFFFSVEKNCSPVTCHND